MNLLPIHLPDLSVNIPQNVADSNPKFVEFLVWLRHHYIDKDCSSLSLKKKVEDSKLSLSKVKRTYIRNKLLVDELVKMGDDAEIDDSMENINSIKQMKSKLDEEIIKSEFSFLCKNNNVKENSFNQLLWGLSPDDIDLNPSYEISETVYIELAKRLKEKIESIQNFFIRSKMDDKLQEKSQSLILSECISNKVLRVEQIHAKYDKISMKLMRESWNCFDNYGNVIIIMLNLLKDHKLNKQLIHDRVFIEWVQKKIQTMSLKLNALEAQILNDTYNKESIEALKTIRFHLQNKHQQINKQYKAIKDQLEQYENLGEPFMSLVNQYSIILKKIENKKWAIEQLNG